MGGFLETTGSLTVYDYYNDHWQQAKVTITISAAGKVSWKIYMTNDTNDGTRGRAVYLNIKVAGKQIAGPGYTTYSSTSNSKWRTYPTGHGTSKSGSFTLSNTSAESVKIETYICCMQNSTSAGKSGSKTITRSKWTDVSAGTTTITDNYNNYFKISATKGANGTNNTASGPSELKWSYDSATYTNTYTNGADRKLDISGTSDTRTVYAKSKTTGERGDSKEAKTSLAIRQYIMPNAPGTPVISYTKNRLTVKEPWTYSWSAADAVNGSSPVKGYRARLYKNGVNIPIIDSSGNTLTTIIDSKFIIDLDTTNRSITFDPLLSGFMPGDKVKLGIIPFTRFGRDNDGSALFRTTETFSAESTVQNAGVVRVKVGGAWKEGQVWVKTAGSWKEAEIVKTKVGGVWKESE